MNSTALDLHPGPIPPDLADAHPQLDAFFADMQGVDAYGHSNRCFESPEGGSRAAGGVTL